MSVSLGRNVLLCKLPFYLADRIDIDRMLLSIGRIQPDFLRSVSPLFQTKLPGKTGWILHFPSLMGKKIWCGWWCLFCPADSQSASIRTKSLQCFLSNESGSVLVAHFHALRRLEAFISLSLRHTCFLMFLVYPTKHSSIPWKALEWKRQTWFESGEPETVFGDFVVSIQHWIWCNFDALAFTMMRWHRLHRQRARALRCEKWRPRWL